VKRIAQAMRHLRNGEELETLFWEAVVRVAMLFGSAIRVRRQVRASVPRWSGC
jgi:hypothetical protein